MSGAILNFQLQRALNSLGPWFTVAALGPTGEKYTNTGLTTGVTYFYRVRARNVAGYGPFSNIVDLTPGATGVVTQPAVNGDFALSMCDPEPPVGSGFGLQVIN